MNLHRPRARLHRHCLAPPPSTAKDGLIEVMKSFHEIKAEEEGTIARFLVENEEAVDAGQDLVEME